jgi:hypothetical protein
MHLYSLFLIRVSNIITIQGIGPRSWYEISLSTTKSAGRPIDLGGLLVAGLEELESGRDNMIGCVKWVRVWANHIAPSSSSQREVEDIRGYFGSIQIWKR